MESDTRELLQAMEARLERMEARQKAQQKRFLLAGAVLVLLAALLFAALMPAVRRYNALLDTLEPVGSALAQMDVQALCAALEGFAGVELSGLEGLDAAALTEITQTLQQLDPETLAKSLEKLQQIDVDRLNGALAQMEKVLADLDGLDADAINTAIANMNKALAPLMKLFD